MAIDRFCGNCGNALINGVCARCKPTTHQGYAPPGGAQVAPPVYAQQSAPAAYGWDMTPGAQYAGNWNWGAFLLCPFWLMNHGRVGRGILYLVLACIPVVNLGCFIMCIVYGAKGNRVAITSRRFIDDAQFVAVQNAWRNWGVGLTLGSIALALFSAILSGAAHAMTPLVGAIVAHPSTSSG